MNFLLAFPKTPKSLSLASTIKTLPRDGDSGNSARLSDADDSRLGVASTVQHLRELCALSRAGLSNYHHNRVPLHRLYDLIFELDDRKVRH